jgi:hypothetical protein
VLELALELGLVQELVLVLGLVLGLVLALVPAPEPVLALVQELGLVPHRPRQLCSQLPPVLP